MRIGRCKVCESKYVWVNQITRHGKDAGEVCADCWDTGEKDKAPRNRTTKSSGMDHNNPWRDNAVRALEEDR
jgi:hypothetical protein